MVLKECRHIRIRSAPFGTEGDRIALAYMPATFRAWDTSMAFWLLGMMMAWIGLGFEI